MNTDLRKKANNDFQKYFFHLMNNIVFGKTMENVRKHRDIKLVTTKRRKSYLVSETNYHVINFFIENLLATDMRKIERPMNKPIYLGPSVLSITNYATLLRIK